jgi:hypothetical protein
MVQFGPMDYSLSIGLPGETHHPRVKEAERKALRLHLCRPNYPLDKLDAEMSRIREQRQPLEREEGNLQKQLAEILKFSLRYLKRKCDPSWRS